MSLSILNNTAASQAAANLDKSTQLHQSNLSRLSSGSRIQNFSDDAGGTAVSLKLNSNLTRSGAAQTNVSNAISFLQTQAGGLSAVSSVLSRMSELVTRMQDLAKNSEDLAGHVAEMSDLSREIDKIRNEKFNGIHLFCNGGNPPPLAVQISQDGLHTTDITQSDLATATIEAIIAHSGTIGEIDPFRNSGGLTVDAYLAALEEVSTLIADNGAQQSRLEFALESLRTNHVNVEAANSRIRDVDVAAESGRLAKASMLVEAGAKMLSQANSTSQIALKLIQPS